MARLTSFDENMGLLVNEEERLLSSKGFIDKDEMYKIMRHLAEKLYEYENLEEQGLLLKIPCRVGNTVYMPSRGEVIQFKIYSLTIYEERIEFKIYYAGNEENLKLWNIRFQEKDIGYKVFLTQAEAEEALIKMKQGI